VPLQEDTPQIRDFYTSHVRFSANPEVWAQYLRDAGLTVIHTQIERYLNDLPELDIIALKPGAEGVIPNA
jgi:hypothetical protein